jgi:hypothetical protein
MHKTEAGVQRKELKRTVLELQKEVKALQNIHQMRPAARTLQAEADRLKAEAEALKDTARRGGPPRMCDGEGEAHQERVPRPIPIGWLPGGKMTKCEMSISAALGRC